MYCPQCAAPHNDAAKFCRSCGLEIEAVALLLSGKPVKSSEAVGNKLESKTEQDWLEKKVAGISGITRGSILLAVSLLIGVAMALFVPGRVPWMLIWMVFFGWMACWGGIETAYGVSGLLESKSRLRLLRAAVREPAIDSTPQRLSAAADPPMLNKPPGAFGTSPLSVTEGTTRYLDGLVEK
ncbi:MAG TPA: zinc ribbon domain-containing protein [Pyrinomonadaceae bacterium]|nr:zinc ribbon domain-containing protein [Pyrinomonadaceae bacterium]